MWDAVAGISAGISAVSGLLSGNEANELTGEQKALIGKQTEVADDLREFGLDQQGYYKQYAPQIYEDIFDEIYEDPDYEGAMGLAVSDVNQAFDNQADQHERKMFRYGIKPGDGTFQDYSKQMGLNKSLAKVGAMNRARRNEDDKKWSKLLTGADINQGFISNAIHAGGSAMGGYGSAGGQYGNLANQHANSAANSFGAAGYLMNGLMKNSNQNSGGSIPYVSDEEYLATP